MFFQEVELLLRRRLPLDQFAEGPQAVRSVSQRFFAGQRSGVVFGSQRLGKFGLAEMPCNL